MRVGISGEYALLDDLLLSESLIINSINIYWTHYVADTVLDSHSDKLCRNGISYGRFKQKKITQTKTPTVCKPFI